MISALPFLFDPVYRANQKQAYQVWVADHPGNWKNYRAGHPDKARRILELMSRMDGVLKTFLKTAEEAGEDPFTLSHGLFVLLKTASKATLVSAARQALQMNACRLSCVKSLLRPAGYREQPVHPRKSETPRHRLRKEGSERLCPS